MKICKKCGAELKDDAIFCTSCGEKVEETPKQVADSKNNIMNHKKLIGIGIAVILAVVVVITLVINAKNTIKLSDYYEITYEGGDGFGKAIVELQDGALEEAICEKKDYSLDDVNYWRVFEAIDRVEVEVTPNENLKNGDKIEVKFKVPNRKMIKGIKLDTDSEKVKVEGLEKYKKITDKDLFKDIELVYTEYSPYLNVSVENKSKDPFLSTVSYEVQNNGEIANGEAVTIEASWDDAEAQNNKCIVNGSGKKEFKVEGQAEYLLNRDMLTDDMLKQIKEQIEADYRAKSLGWEKYTFKSLKEAYLIDKTNTDWDINEIYVLIEVEPTERGKEDGETALYFDGSYEKVSIRDGEVFLGNLDGGLFDIYDTRNVFEEDLENYKANAKGAYNLLAEEH